MHEQQGNSRRLQPQQGARGLRHRSTADNRFFKDSGHGVCTSIWELPTHLYTTPYTRVRATQIHHLLSQTQATTQEPKHKKATAGSYELDQRYSTPSNSTDSSKQHKAESEHLPQQTGAESDDYANRLQKGDVFAHLTSLKQTSESNIQTKRLSKRSPTLPLLLQSELSTVGNRRR
ncbi:hypothetical protein F511_27877 [Dorcoceras hygrometricum]|uniref:Uncharacterized protein n=1 Tax=Dorcoceras hygrometricum TaxID=472368 RepID=A0A2Z7A864_9LAMI|nr:hypothetical protein F511_27877 [Dorcoceras hygrometricum]